MSDLSGQSLRGYALRERIGAGAFGEVYRARQQAIFDREVALKVIAPQYANQPDFIRDFESEARLVSQLEHPHIVPLLDYWREPDSAYLVMRVLRGGSLDDRLEDHALSTNEALKLLAYEFGGFAGGARWSKDMEHSLVNAGGKLYILDVRWQTYQELIAYAKDCCLLRALTPDERELFGLPPAEISTNEPESSQASTRPYVASSATFGLASVGLGPAVRRSSRGTRSQWSN